MTLQRFIAPHWIPFRNMGCHPWQDKWQPKPINFFFFQDHAISFTVLFLHLSSPPPVLNPLIYSHWTWLLCAETWTIPQHTVLFSKYTQHVRSLKSLNHAVLGFMWRPCHYVLMTQFCMQADFIDANILFKGILRFEHNQIDKCCLLITYW